MDTQLISGSEALMRSLQHERVSTLFCYPGGSIMPVYDALFDYHETFKQVLVRHEQAAVHAAQGYARTSGRVGVCIVTSGPGATNTVTGISDAMLDSTPVVVIAGQVPAAFLGTDAFQEIDFVGVTQPITKWSYQIRRAQDIPWAVARAFYIARSGRPGPVVLDFTKNAQVEKLEYAPVTVDFVRSYRPCPPVDNEAVARAATLINGARRPLALVGQGVELASAHRELAAFLTKGDIPAGCTLLGLSALPSDDRLNMGMLGMHGNLAPNVKTNECDVLIAIGMRFDDRVTSSLKSYARQAQVIHLDIDDAEIGKNVAVEVPLLGDCKETLPLLTAAIEQRSHTAWIESFGAPRQIEEERVITPALHPSRPQICMGEAVRAVSEATGHSAVLVTDVGQNQMMAARYFKFTRERSMVTSGGLGTMGFGLPAAIGATFGAPDRTVCLFTGDGGLQMNLQELGTIMEQQAPVKMILLNNHYLGNVRQWQELFFNHRYSCTPLLNPDFNMVASAYAIPSRTVTQREELPGAVDEMLSTPGPFLLQVAVYEEENVWPMIPLGGTVSDMKFCKEDF